jgi:hypothetical protein
LSPQARGAPLLPGHPPCRVAPPLGNLIGQPQSFPHIQTVTYSNK